uniref:Growth inhibitor PemK n=1 Tax=Caulobacter sp. (strain K31) TaxID=366602 RepID=B0T9S3_CAUSK
MAIPDPEPGLVVQFNYLWSSEYDRGRQEARYPRSFAVVLSYRRTADGATIALLAPITHSEPRDGDRAIEIPLAVKRQLGLDDQRSWVMVDEVNETAWPGYDLHQTSRANMPMASFHPACFGGSRRR